MNNSPQFTRRHYIWLAAAMRDVVSKLSDYFDPEIYTEKEFEYNQNCIKLGIKIFAETLSSENPNFDKGRFLNNVFCSDLIQTK